MRGYQSGTNPDVAIIIPSTGRAEQCARLVERIYETSWTGPSIVVSVEPHDAEPYSDALARWAERRGGRVVLVWDLTGQSGPASHVAAINRAACLLADETTDGTVTAYPKVIIKMDDDHWPLAIGWDQFYLDSLNALGGTGVVYGNDLHQGERLPTVPGLSADIVRELGWYAPPQLGHLFCDNFWLELGRRSGRLSYMPDVIIEHRHPDAGKASNDDTYQQGGRNEGRWITDRAEWEKIISTPVEETGRTFFTNPTQMDLWAESVELLAEQGSSR